MQKLQDMRVRSLGQEESLEEEVATHSSILAWKIPLSQLGSHTHRQTHTHIHGQRSLLGCRPRVCVRYLQKVTDEGGIGATVRPHTCGLGTQQQVGPGC